MVTERTQRQGDAGKFRVLRKEPRPKFEVARKSQARVDPSARPLPQRPAPESAFLLDVIFRGPITARQVGPEQKCVARKATHRFARCRQPVGAQAKLE